MIKDNQKKLNRIHVLLDVVMTVLAYFLAWLIIVSGKVIPLEYNVKTLEPPVYFAALIFIIPVYLVLNACFHLYVPKRIQGRRSEFANICKANVIGLMFFTLILFGGRNIIIHLGYFSTRMLLCFFVLNILLLEAERMAIRLFLRSLRTNGYNQKHILLVGYSRAAEGFIDRVALNPEWGYHIQGILDDGRPSGYAYKNVRILGTINQLESVLAANTLDEIAITLSINEYSNLESIVAVCEKSGVHTKFIPDYNNIIPTIPYMEDLQGLPVIHIRHVPLTNVFNATVKRIVDIGGALFGLLLFSPVMLLTAGLIKLTSPGPAVKHFKKLLFIFIRNAGSVISHGNHRPFSLLFCFNRNMGTGLCILDGIIYQVNHHLDDQLGIHFCQKEFVLTAFRKNMLRAFPVHMIKRLFYHLIYQFRRHI